MLEKFNRVRRRRKPGEFRSNLEEKISKDLTKLGLDPQYEVDRFRYILPAKKYTPDFKCGDFYIEVKGYWPSSERTKFLSVVIHNPDLPIFVALQRPFMAISKTSKTSYALWCQKHGIRWCPTPIPKEFLMQWATGPKPTFHVRTQKGVAAQTELLYPRTTDQYIVSPVPDISSLTIRKR